MPERKNTIRFGVLVADALEAARRRPVLVAVVVLALPLPMAVFEAFLEPREAMTVGSFFGLVQLYLQLLLTASVLADWGLVPAGYDPRRPTSGRFAGAVGLSIIYFVGVSVGLLLLVVPGLLLILRWSVSLPALVGEDLDILAALRRSWRLTRNHPLAAATVYGTYLCLLLPSAALILLYYPDDAPPPLAAALLSNLLFALSATTLWLLTAALYRRLRIAETEQNIEFS